MGRPLGSKNKPKVTTALIGEVISKPITQKQLRTAVGAKITEEIDNEIISRLKGNPPNPDFEPIEDVNAAVLAEVAPKGLEPTPKKKLPKGVRDIADKIDFIMEDLQSLRNYMCRFEDAFAAAKKEGILIQSPDLPEELKTKKHRRRKTH